MHTPHIPRRMLGAVLLLTWFLLFPSMGTAAAASKEHPHIGYYIENTGGEGTMSWSGPATIFKPVQMLREGEGITITCQAYGQVVGGPSIWDQLKGGSWVPDIYTSTEAFNVFTPGLARCRTREQRAIDWARNQLGQTTQPDGKPWNNWCDRFVAKAYGKSNSGYTNAAVHWADLSRRGLTHPGDLGVPAGALAFYSNSVGGHVMLSEGNGMFVSTGPQVYETEFSTIFGSYLGWAYANPEWPGR